MDVMVGVTTEDEAFTVRAFLSGFRVAALDATVRGRGRPTAPDQASSPRRCNHLGDRARTQRAILVTRNTKDFPATEVGIRIPYALTAEPA